MNLPDIAQQPTPKGKRSVRRTVWGNLNGYVSGKFWITFGDAFDQESQRKAEAWVNAVTAD